MALVFLRLGLTAFGGPLAHIALMREEVVRRRGWLAERDFLGLIAAANLVPGPNSTELALALGRRRAGWSGFLLAGACFIGPAVLIVLGLAWLYVEHGSMPQLQAVLAGIKPVVVAVVVAALAGLGRALVRERFLVLLAVASAGAHLAGVHELALLAAGGVAAVGWRVARGDRPRGVLVGLLGLGGAAGAAAAAPAVTLPALFLVFLKVGALLYGSGYVLLAFLRADLVERLGWLSDAQLLDAISIGQLTPGPVFSTATFVGYVLAGVPGAVVATAGIFLPAFAFVALLEPIVREAQRHAWATAAVDGLGAASLGLMAAVTVVLTRDALLPGGRPDPLAVLLAPAALALLASGRLGPTSVIGLGVAAGFVRWALTGG